VQDRRGRGKGLFFLDNASVPLSKLQLERDMKELMLDAGIPKEYTPYSIKHASITWLLAHGVSESIINRNARLSQHAGTAVKHYFLGQTCQVVSAAIAGGKTQDTHPLLEMGWKEITSMPLNLPKQPEPFKLPNFALDQIKVVPAPTNDDIVADPLLFLSVCECLCSLGREEVDGGSTPKGGREE
jgi:hypothetical protein